MKLFSVLALLLLGLTGNIARAADAWPSKPIRFVVAAPAGSSLDIIARTVGDKLKDRLNQAVIVENVPGAFGTIATAQVARAAPDGYTMLLSFNGPLAFIQFMTKLPYDPQRDLQPVMIASSQPNILAVNADLPVRTLKDLITHANANPGKLNYASVGNGSSSHLTMELFKSMTGTYLVHIPYNGAPPAAASVVAGDTQLLFSVPTVVLPHVRSGKVKALAVTSRTRFSLLPDIPTMAEAGMPAFESLAWNGVLVPARTPPDVVKRLNAELNAIIQMADVKARLNNAGLEPVGGTPEAFKKLIDEEAAKWEPVIRKTKAKLD
ncbi:Bug family tripartite tricarboxylate transporter substrate binding protein [Noviherbaspirillum sp.]|uniref:Bug family tripartite tricarboxylate transporter substrate binding protein n=1 Tax=Noviherbaspirillum sp. TaxID=1926288 RepID=UPI002FDF3F13